MAITTSTFKVNAGWATTDVITQMEQAMTKLRSSFVKFDSLAEVLSPKEESDESKN